METECVPLPEAPGLGHQLTVVSRNPEIGLDVRAEFEARGGDTERNGEKTHSSDHSHAQNGRLEAFSPRDATDLEIETLPYVIDRVPFAAWAVIFAGAAERFTYFGLIAPWRESQLPLPQGVGSLNNQHPENYMQNPRGNHAVPGALGLGQATAVNIYNAFFLFSFLTPVPFALVSDIWLGRYKTLMIGLT